MGKVNGVRIYSRFTVGLGNYVKLSRRHNMQFLRGAALSENFTPNSVSK